MGFRVCCVLRHQRWPGPDSSQGSGHALCQEQGLAPESGHVRVLFQDRTAVQTRGHGQGRFQGPACGPPYYTEKSSAQGQGQVTDFEHQIEHEGRSMQQNEAGSEAVAMAGPDDDPHPWEVDCRHLFRVRGFKTIPVEPIVGYDPGIIGSHT